MDAYVLVFVLFVIVDVALWVAVIAAPLSTAGRYRVVSCAAILLATLAAGVIGWPRTAVVSSLAVWLAAIAAGSLPRDIPG